jgi:hypothetical protein
VDGANREEYDMTPLGIGAGIAGGWLILAAMGATVPHRLRRIRPKLADAPPTLAPRDDLMAFVPADCLSDDDAELHGRFWGLIAREWVL